MAVWVSLASNRFMRMVLGESFGRLCVNRLELFYYDLESRSPVVAWELVFSLFRVDLNGAQGADLNLASQLII